MRPDLIFSLIFAALLSAAAVGSSWIEPATPRHPGTGLANAETAETRPDATGASREPPPPPLPGKDKVYLPTTVHLRDKTVMVLINAGNFATGSPGSESEGDAEKNPARQTPNVQAFYMDLNEITVEKYKAFNPKYDEKPHTGNQPCPACPAMGIDWAGANQYCLWAGKRLPTEAEWEAAARGYAANAWPWGNEFLPMHANLLGSEDGYAAVAPVGSFPSGASPYGVMDMIGNVWEWVGTPYSPAPGQTTAKTDFDKTLRIAKGGGWSTPPKIAKISFRNIVDPSLKNPTFGFRCGKSLD